jgi:hypothetical protein
MAGLEPVPPANLDGLYHACTDDGGRALEYEEKTVYRRVTPTEKAIERNTPDHPQFKPLRIFRPVRFVKPDKEVVRDKRLAELVPVFITRYSKKRDIEISIDYAFKDGHLPTERHKVRIGSAWNDQFRRVSPVLHPVQFVLWAIGQGADLPTELRAFAEQHKEPAPVGIEAGANEKSRPVDDAKDEGSVQERSAKIPGGFYSPRQLADHFGIPATRFNAFEKALKKFRDKNLLGVGFIKHDAPAKNMPHFFYSVKEVRAIALRYIPADSGENSDGIQTD